MKRSIFFALVLSFISSTASAVPSIKCGGIEYSRIDQSSKWGIAGDSNGRFEKDFTLGKQDQWIAQDEYRFMMDQSTDPNPGLYGIEMAAVYSEGNGLQLVFMARKYKTTKKDSPFEVFANWGMMVDGDVKTESSGILGSKIVKLGLENGLNGIDLMSAIKSGKLVQDDLFYMNVGYCKFTP